MENDMMDIIKNKRDWADRRKGIDRRKKDGSIEERKTTADVLRAGRHRVTDHLKYCTCSICELKGQRLRDGYPWWFKMWHRIFPVIIIMLISGSAHAYTGQQAVLAVIGEAEGESQRGKEAVACAIHYRGTLQGVYGLNAPRVKKHLYSAKTYKDAQNAVRMAQNEQYCQDLVAGAQYWEGTAFKMPYWARSMKVTAVIGHQRFFKG